jgi:phospholipid/cholesterol/gamma-HCH transport system permease protein
MRYLFELFGEKSVNILNYVGSVFKLLFQTLVYLFIPPFKAERVMHQAKRIGVDSLLIVSIVAIFTGMILALQTAYQMQMLSSEIYIANIVALSLVRELGPVLTALIVAGRSGAGITAEVGTMTVTEQIDALYTLANNPVKYLVVPRFLSLIFVLPLLTLYADLLGIFGGYFVGVYRLGISSSMYLTLTFDALAFKDLFTGLLKATFFGMIIATVGCFEGLNARGGAEGVGKATTTSVVISFVAIIAADCFFTFLFYVLGQ